MSLGRKTVKVSSVFIGSITAVMGERGTTIPPSMAVTTTCACDGTRWDAGQA